MNPYVCLAIFSSADYARLDQFKQAFILRIKCLLTLKIKLITWFYKVSFVFRLG